MPAITSNFLSPHDFGSKTKRKHRIQTAARRNDTMLSTDLTRATGPRFSSLCYNADVPTPWHRAYICIRSMWEKSMHKEFASYVGDLETLFDRLVGMSAVRIVDLRPPLPQKCVYLFTEGEKHLYVGRTKHLRTRMRQHSIEAASHNQAVFAFRLARHEMGHIRASYQKATSRAALLTDPAFAKAFRHAKERIRRMDLRFVEVDDPLKQALLEIYAAVVLRTAHNDFDTH